METPGGDQTTRRAAFMELAGEMYERMFGQDQQHQLITFTQREDRALELGEALQTALLKEHLARDPMAQPAEHRAACCPDCRQAGQLQKSQERVLRARTGEARWPRAVYYCKRCRRSFSPSRHRSGAGPGRL